MVLPAHVLMLVVLVLVVACLALLVLLAIGARRAALQRRRIVSLQVDVANARNRANEAEARARGVGGVGETKVTQIRPLPGARLPASSSVRGGR